MSAKNPANFARFQTQFSRAFQNFLSRKSVHLQFVPPVTFVGKLAIFGPLHFQILATPLVFVM
jgi:hypothetical protein